MQKTAIKNQRDANRNIQQCKPIKQKDPRASTSRRKSIKSKQEQHKPENRIDSFDWEFRSSEEQRKEWDVTSYRERTEGTEVATVFEGDEGEGDDDEEDGLFVDVPAEEEGGVATEGDGTDEGIPCWIEEEFYEGDDLEEEG